MLLSLAFIFLCGLALGSLFRLIKLPRIIGMLAAGRIIGPCALDLLGPDILAISPISGRSP